MKIYIDLGAHTGKTTETWLVEHPQGTAYAFEPNPACLMNPRWRHILDHWPRASLIQAAAWIAETNVRLYRDPMRPAGQSSTIMPGKRSGDVNYEGPIIVRAIDFSAWLQMVVQPGEDVTLKMDIEGAEYDVLEKMLDDETIGLVSRLWIEFHAAKFEDNCLLAREQVLRRRLEKRGLEMTVAEH